MSDISPEAYLESKVRGIIEPMLSQITIDQPNDPVYFMIEWLNNLQGKNSFFNTEKDELKNLRKEISILRKKFEKEDDELKALSAADVYILS